VDWLSPVRGIFEFILPFLDRLLIVRAILGFVLVFVLPGFAWTLVFFNGRQINLIERLAISFGLSLALVTLSILALNWLIGMGITGLNAVLVIGAITVVPLVLYFLRWFMGRQGNGAA
jgi:uncharacterized membrane protein